jgi:hypothetical protein
LKNGKLIVLWSVSYKGCFAGVVLGKTFVKKKGKYGSGHTRNLTLERLRKEYHEFKASIGYKVRGDPVSKK